MSQTASGQGGNSTAVRLYNERVVLAALRRLGEASKADLARHASLTSNAAGQIVQQLERQRLVRTIGKRAGGRGQPATLLSLDPEGAYAIGVKLGRRSLHVALVNFNGAVLKLRRHDRAFSPRQALTVALSEVARMRQAIPRIASARLAGVGLAIPYNLGAWRRELGMETESDAAWRGFDFASVLRDSLDVPLFDENDGTAVAVAELFQGHGRELDDFVNIYIGTALGGGVVLGGEYRRGVTANAGDIGLMPVAPSRLLSTPKPGRSRDILLTRASISSLIRHVRANGIAVVGRADLDRAIEAHPGLIAEWLDDCADALVDPVLSIGSVLDLQAVVIDGDLPRALIERLVTRLRAMLAAAVPEAREPPALRLGTIGRDAAVIGAAILPLHLNYSPDQHILFGNARPVVLDA